MEQWEERYRSRQGHGMFRTDKPLGVDFDPPVRAWFERLGVVLSIAAGEGGVPEVNGIERAPGEPPLTGKRLRELPLQQLLEDVVGRTVQRPLRRPPKKRHGAITDETFLEAAARYRLALSRHSRHPTEDVAAEMHVSRTQASRYLRGARDRGLLGEALPRKAGEQKARGEQK